MTQELLGDRVERLLKTIKADKLAKLYERIGKKPCGCERRKAALNRWHHRALDVLEEWESARRLTTDQKDRNDYG